MVEETFAQLTEEGFLRRGVGHGTFVLERALPKAASATRRPQPLRAPSRRGVVISAHAGCREPEVTRAFNSGIADAGEFPWRTWRELQAQVCRTEGPRAMGLADPRGVRSCARRSPGTWRSSAASGAARENVVVFNSAQQAILSSWPPSCFRIRATRVWLEEPRLSRERARRSSLRETRRWSPVPVDDQGIQVDAGIRRVAGRTTRVPHAASPVPDRSQPRSRWATSPSSSGQVAATPRSSMTTTTVSSATSANR